MILTLINLVLIASLVGFLLFVFSPSFRAWVLSKLVEQAQRKMQERMQDEFGQRAKEPEEEERERVHHHGKVPLDDIEAKRFEKGQNDEYVEFEELP